jgi:hypothetical protein
LILSISESFCRWRPVGFLSYRTKSSRICGLNRSPVVVFRTRPAGVRWNAWEEINCFWVEFLSSISHVFLLALFRVFVAVPSPVSNADSLSIARRSWRVRREGFGLILRHRQSSGEEFWWAPIHPPLVAFSGPSTISHLYVFCRILKLT